jgi:hypothetical protein
MLPFFLFFLLQAVKNSSPFSRVVVLLFAVNEINFYYCPSLFSIPRANVILVNTVLQAQLYGADSLSADQ